MDNLNPEQRRKNMQNIRSKDTLIEIKIRSELHKRGLRFRKNYNKLYGKPDIVFIKSKVVIFLDSCFWHKCPYHYVEPKSNTEYWVPKLNKNRERARKVNAILRKEGWEVIRIWEHEIKKDYKKVVANIYKIVKS